MTDKSVKEICDYHLASIFDGDNEDLMPRDGKTFCNIFVQRICRNYGYDKLDNKLANSIYDFCSISEDFVKISSDDAHDYATKGLLCIAALRSEPHGHVAIVYPGFKVFSGKWNKEVPRVVTCGNTIGIMGVNYAFKEEPEYFLLRGTS